MPLLGEAATPVRWVGGEESGGARGFGFGFLASPDIFREREREGERERESPFCWDTVIYTPLSPCAP